MARPRCTDTVRTRRRVSGNGQLPFPFLPRSCFGLVRGPSAKREKCAGGNDLKFFFDVVGEGTSHALAPGKNTNMSGTSRSIPYRAAVTICTPPADSRNRPLSSSGLVPARVRFHDRGEFHP